MSQAKAVASPSRQKLHGSIMLNVNNIPWLPFPLEGTSFKPLHIDDDQGKATILLRVPAGQHAEVHRHLAAVEVYVVQGGFTYEGEGSVAAGDYVYEPGGMVHEPVADSGGDDLVMFVVSQGPIVGVNADGSPGGIIDNNLIYELARQGGAHGHLHRSL
ncbi:MAG TPA: 2,4'-dihydroxyacetophenone dioxygenase family protein [Rhizomicrobium sp.]|jgi:quercetin dioxygenase-like cupin family protein